MASPPIINCAELVTPITGENDDNPAGSPIQYQVEQKLDASRKEFEETAEGRQPRDPEWANIIKVCEFQLAGKSKDLRLATRLLEALTKVHGVVGLRDGITFLRTMVAECWDRMHPVPEEDETMDEVRGELLTNNLNDPDAGIVFPLTVRNVPLVVIDKKPYSLQDKLQADKGKGEVSPEDFGRAEPLNEHAMEDLQQTIAELEQLTKLLEEKMLDNPPSFTKLEDALNECRLFLQHFIPEPEPEAEEDDAEASGDGEAKKSTDRGTVTTREEAYKQLAKIASVLDRIEPHSPIPDLLRRAVELGRLPFRDLIREIVRDDKLLKDVNREFGIKEQPSK